MSSDRNDLKNDNVANIFNFWTILLNMFMWDSTLNCEQQNQTVEINEDGNYFKNTLMKNNHWISLLSSLSTIEIVILKNAR